MLSSSFQDLTSPQHCVPGILGWAVPRQGLGGGVPEGETPLVSVSQKELIRETPQVPKGKWEFGEDQETPMLSQKMGNQGCG